MPAAVRIELLGGDGIEALRRLAVPFFLLGTEPSRPFADRIGGEACEASVLLEPKLKLPLVFEDTDKHRYAKLDAVSRKTLVDAGEVGRAGQRLAGMEAGQVIGTRHVNARAIDE